MDAHAIDQVSKQVYQRFPGLKGSHPTISAYATNLYLLIFKGSASAEDGRTIRTTVRVVVGPDGKIVKMTSSR